MTDFRLHLLPILLLETFMTYTTGRNFTVGLLIPYTTPGRSADLFGIRYAPASLLALENINNSTDLLPGHHLSLVWNDTKCDPNLSLKALIYQIYEKRVDAVIGPACSCQVEARLANVENIPMISYVSSLIILLYWRRTAEIPYWWCATTQIWVLLLIGWSKFSSRHDQSEALLISG